MSLDNDVTHTGCLVKGVRENERCQRVIEKERGYRTDDKDDDKVTNNRTKSERRRMIFFISLSSFTHCHVMSPVENKRRY